MALGSALPDNFAAQFAGRTLSGGLTGGVVSEMYGGDFGEGFMYGAGTAAAGYLFNESIHHYLDVRGSVRRLLEKKVITPARAIAPVIPKTAGFLFGISTIAFTGGECIRSNGGRLWC